MTEFIDRFQDFLKEKKSILCVGLDPALPYQRNKDVLPASYLKEGDENEARLNFCLDIIDQIKDYAIAVKPNAQYLFGFTKEQHQKLTRAIKNGKMLSILDYKLNDIGETIESGIFHIAECGYDAVTFNPLPGNLEEAVHFAHNYVKKLRGTELGIFVLTLMSNPEAPKYMKETSIYGRPLFLMIAEDVKKFEADGCVVGATGHVTLEDIKNIRATVGDDKVFLVPGIGAQRGDPEKVIKAAGKNLIINVGRSIVYSSDPKRSARKYFDLFNKIRGCI